MFVFIFAFGEVTPISREMFLEHNDNVHKIIDLYGKDYIVVSLREEGADGRFYAIDSDGDLWQSGVISSGAIGHGTPTGVFNVLKKTRYHMSSTYPNTNGVNNMDYSMYFTNRGHALHLGNVDQMSHGCVHISINEIQGIFDWVDVGTTIVITRGNFENFVRRDLILYGLY